MREIAGWQILESSRRVKGEHHLKDRQKKLENITQPAVLFSLFYVLLSDLSLAANYFFSSLSKPLGKMNSNRYFPLKWYKVINNGKRKITGTPGLFIWQNEMIDWIGQPQGSHVSLQYNSMWIIPSVLIMGKITQS